MSTAAPSESTDRSTLPLSQAARHLIIPAGIVDTLWFDVELELADFGIYFDTWQDELAQLALGLREDGHFACTTGAVAMSIPRQVAKTFIVLSICIALCTMYEGTTVLWTAHRVSTTTSAFDRARAMCRDPRIKRRLLQDRSGGIHQKDGAQEIRFANGSVMKFGSRQQGYGRGESEIDIEVFDEAQMLLERALEDMVAATLQSRFPHGALLFYMGTPPRPIDPGEVFSDRRRDALAFAAEGQKIAVGGDTLYLECSADPDVGRPGGPELMDPAQVEKANPSFPHRTSWLAILRLRKNLKSDAAWRREGLGVWDDAGIRLWQVISAKEWAACDVTATGDDIPEKGHVAFGVKFSADGQRIGVGAAIRSKADLVFVEALNVFATADGTDRLVTWLAERGENATIAVDGKAGAGDLVAQLINAGVSKRHVHEVTTPEAVRAHAGFLRGVREVGVIHSGQKGLENQVKVAGIRTIGNLGGWGWQPVTPDGDTTALDAVTIAFGEATSGRAGYTGEAVIA